MTKIEEADADLKDLIDRALRGEAVAITRGGQVVARISAEQGASPARGMTPEQVATMRERAMSRGKGGDAGRLLQDIRNEDWR